MTDTTVAATPAASEQSATTETAIPAHVAAGDGPLSVRDAARSIIDWRRKSAAGDISGQEPSATPATTEPAQSETAQAGDDATPADEQPSGEESEAPEPAAEPPIEPPKFWTKEAKERWASLPRDTQEYLAQREQERDREVRRSQNETAEKLKGLTAKEQAVEQARGQYEHALPILLSNLQTAYQGEFADIRTMDDVQKLATTDPIRYTQWDAAQKRMAAVQQEVSAAQERQAAEYGQALNAFRQREAALFAEKAPEFAKPEEAKKLMDGAVNVLRDVGFQDAELGELWRGEKNISIHDHRLHLLLRDGVKWRDAQSKAKTVQAKALPPVQRPGAAQPKGARAAAELQTLTKQLDSAKGNNALRIAAQLQQARRRAGG